MASKFINLAIAKQDMAYKKSYAIKQFSYSCDRCCAQGLSNGRFNCANCPVKAAHIRALTEIDAGDRGMAAEIGEVNIDLAVRKHTSKGKVTLVLRY